MSRWEQVFQDQNINWLLVLILGTVGTAIGTVCTNAVTVHRAHNRIRLWSEFLVNQQLTYFAFFPALLVALNDLKEWYKNSCIAIMFISILMFVLGLMNIKSHETVLRQGHRCQGSSCAAVLTAKEKSELIGLNRNLSLAALILVLALVFSLQVGKKPASLGTVDHSQQESR